MSGATKKILMVKPLYHEAGAAMLAREADLLTAKETDEGALQEQIAEMHGVFVPAPFFLSGKVIAAGKRLEVICGAGVGDNIDLASATAHGIPVVYDGPGGGGSGVAEHVIGLMICLAKNIVRGHNALTRNNDYEIRYSFTGSELRGKTMGIVGLGGVGRALAGKCHLGFSMPILAHDPFVDAAEDFIELAPDLASVFRRADFISVHVPMVAENERLIGSGEFSEMKPTAYFINTSRGGVIDEQALYKALSKKRIAGAALDVFDPEPPARDNPLFFLENVIVTPHIAGMTEETLRATSISIAEQMLKVLRGEKPDHLLNPEYRNRRHEGK